MSLKLPTALWGRVFGSKTKLTDTASETTKHPDNSSREQDKKWPENENCGEGDEPEICYEMMNESRVPANVFSNYCDPPPVKANADREANDSFSESDDGDVYEETDEPQVSDDGDEYEETEDPQDCGETEEIYDLPPPETQISNRPLPPPPTCASPSDEYEVTDLYDTIDDTARKRLKHLAERTPLQARDGQTHCTDELYEEFDENECSDTSHQQGTDQKIVYPHMDNDVLQKGRTPMRHPSNTIGLQRCESISPPYTPPPPTPPESPVPPAQSPSPSPPPPPLITPSRASPLPPPPIPSFHPFSQVGHLKSLPPLPSRIKASPPNSSSFPTPKFLDASRQSSNELCSSQRYSLSSDCYLDCSSVSSSPQPTILVPPRAPKPLTPPTTCPKKLPLKPPASSSAVNHLITNPPVDRRRSQNCSDVQHTVMLQEDAAPPVKNAMLLESLHMIDLAHRIGSSRTPNQGSAQRQQVNLKPKPKPKSPPLLPRVVDELLTPISKVRISAQNEVVPSRTSEEETEEFKPLRLVQHETSNKLQNENDIYNQSDTYQDRKGHITNITPRRDEKTHLKCQNSEQRNEELLTHTHALLPKINDCLPKWSKHDMECDQGSSEPNDKCTDKKEKSKQDVVTVKSTRYSVTDMPHTLSEGYLATQLSSKPIHSPNVVHTKPLPGNKPKFQTWGKEHRKSADLTQPIANKEVKCSRISRLESSFLDGPEQVNTSMSTTPKVTFSLQGKKPSLPHTSTKCEPAKANEHIGRGSDQLCNDDWADHKKPALNPTPIGHGDGDVLSHKALQKEVLPKRACTSPPKGRDFEPSQEKIIKNKPMISPKPNVVIQQLDAPKYGGDMIQTMQAAKASSTKKPPLPQKPKSFDSHQSPTCTAKLPSCKLTETSKTLQPPLVHNLTASKVHSIQGRTGMIKSPQHSPPPNPNLSPSPSHNEPYEQQVISGASCSGSSSNFHLKSEFCKQPINVSNNRSTVEEQTNMSKNAPSSHLLVTSGTQCSSNSEAYDSIGTESYFEENYEESSESIPTKPYAQTPHSEVASGHRLGSQMMMNELSNAFLTLKAKSKANSCHDEAKHTFTKSTTSNDVSRSPIKLKSWKAVHNSENTQSKPALPIPDELTNHAVSKLEGKLHMEAKGAHGPSKAFPPSSNRQTRMLGEKPSGIEPKAAFVVNSGSDGQIRSSSTHKSYIKPKAVQLQSSDKSSDQLNSKFIHPLRMKTAKD